MHSDFDSIDVDVEKQVCFDQLETLVDQSCRICGDNFSHYPGWVGKRLLRRYQSQLLAGVSAKRPTRSRQDQFAHLARLTGEQALRERRVFTIDRNNLTGLRGIRD